MATKTWAHVLNGIVREVIPLDAALVPGKDVYTPSFAKTLFDVTALDPRPAEGWSYDGKTFVPSVSALPPLDLAADANAPPARPEDGGITVSGVPIATDDRSKTLVLGARRRVEKDPSLVTKWSAADGSIYPLDASTIIAVSDAIGDFVAELFEAYAGIMADLAAGTITTPGEIDARYGALDIAF